MMVRSYISPLKFKYKILEIYGEDVAKLQKYIFSMIVKKNIVISSVTIKKDSLEEIFLREVKSNG